MFTIYKTKKEASATLWSKIIRLSLSIAGVLTCISIYEDFYQKNLIYTDFFSYYLDSCSTAAKLLLESFGIPVLHELDTRTLRISTFQIIVNKYCDGLRMMILPVTTILLVPYTATYKKIIGITFAIILMYSINILRIASLLWIGQYHSTWFYIFHDSIWPFIQVFVAAAIFVLWVLISDKI